MKRTSRRAPTVNWRDFVSYLAGLVAPFAVLTAVCGGWWLLTVYAFEGTLHRSRTEIFWYNAFNGITIWWILLVCAGFGLWWSSFSFDWSSSSVMTLLSGALPVVLVCISLLMIFRGYWDWGKDAARYYGQETTFVVEDAENLPDALYWLGIKGYISDNEGILTPGHNMPGVITEGVLSELGWLDRSASLNAAASYIVANSGTRQGTEAREETLAYLYVDTQERPDGSFEARGMWTMIRDGKNINSPLHSVLMWDGGAGEITSCNFAGDYKINRALRGGRKNSLRHYIRSQEPYRLFSLRISDSYGFCKNGQPFVVMPVRRPVINGFRAMEEFAGVLLITGSSTGEPVINYRESVAPGDIPGPVYPLSLAEKQRGYNSWLGGTENWMWNDFGFEEVEAESQSTNPTEYHLFSRADGRTYWVTPLTLRGTDSQVIQAFAVIASDTGVAGRLNPQTIYVLDTDREQTVVVDRLLQQAQNCAANLYPNFQIQGGELVEFVPGPDGSWSVFGEWNDLAIIRVRIQPGTDGCNLEFMAFAPGMPELITDLQSLPDEELRRLLEQADEILNDRETRQLAIVTPEG